MSKSFGFAGWKLSGFTGMVLALVFAWSGGVRADGAAIDYGMGPLHALVQTPHSDRKTAQFAFMYPAPAPATWPGPMHWRYNHANAPLQWRDDKAGAIQLIANASTRWSAACGVQFVYDGETTAAPYSTLANGEVDRINVIGWQAPDAGMYGATYWTFDSVAGYLDIIDSDTILNPAFVASTQQLVRTMGHEWGHAIGLGHSNVSDALMSGPPSTNYTNLADLATDDVQGCRCLYGPPADQRAGYICSLPDHVDFGTLDPGTASAPYRVSVTNSGNAPITILGVRTGSADFSVVDNGCATGSAIAPGGSCAFSLSGRPAASGARIDEALIDTSEGPYRIPLRASGREAPASVAPPTATPLAPLTVAQVAPPSAVDVIEFYHAGLDHYFISSLASDIAALDGGRFAGWVRTGRTFRAYATVQNGTSPVCRIYIPDPYGQSHFFSASPNECADTLAKFPQLILESSAVMYVGIPDMTSGACPQGSAPVYRVWNHRSDSNHRYTTDRALRNAMVAQGQVAEGYGPDAVAMCAAP